MLSRADPQERKRPKETAEVTFAVLDLSRTESSQVQTPDGTFPRGSTAEDGFPGGSAIKMLETRAPSHSRGLAWRSSWTEEPGGLHFMGSQ